MQVNKNFKEQLRGDFYLNGHEKFFKNVNKILSFQMLLTDDFKSIN